MRIGILDDNPGICDMLKDMLELEGHTVSAYFSSEAFLTAIHVEQLHFDLIIIDLHLPGRLSGVQVIQHVRMDYPNLPAILISASSLREIGDASHELSGVQTLQKPLSMAQLLKAVKAVAYPY